MKRFTHILKTHGASSPHEAAPEVSPRIAWLIFGTAFCICAFIFFLRFPNNFQQPNFYAEDGSIFTYLTINQGWLGAMFSTFNGYYICGLYVLEDIGMIINWALYGGQLVTLPQSLALTSYGFMALVATLPILVLRKYVPMVWLMALAVLVLFVPLPGTDYAILGTIGNLKFVFLYLAVVALVYRHHAPEGSRWIWLCDAALLLCAYTNVTVYALMPFALVRYVPKMSRDWRSTLRRLSSDRSFMSLVILGVLLVPQLVIVKLNGIPKLPGYLDTPFPPERGIEVFVWRTYLFGFLHPFIKTFNDVATVIVALVSLGALAYQAHKQRYVYSLVLGLYAALMGTLLFAINRPGIGGTFLGYKASGPDQFFYSQNLIMYLVLIIALARLTAAWRPRFRAGAVLAVIILCLIPAQFASTYGSNNFMADDTGTVMQNMKEVCLHTTGDTASFSIYPQPNLRFKAPRNQVCSSRVADFTLQRELSLGLSPTGAGLIPYPGSTTKVTQTFTSPKNKLDGIKLFVATYSKPVKSDFMLTLYDGSCQRTLATSKIKGSTLIDNQMHPIVFAMQPHSAGVTYCFSVAPSSPRHISPIALRASPVDTYLDGTTSVNGTPAPGDLVFSLLYAEK